MKKFFLCLFALGLVGLFASQTEARTVVRVNSFGHHNVGFGYGHNFGFNYGFNYRAVAVPFFFPVAPAYQVAAPIVAAQIPYSVPACDPVVPAVAAAPVCAPIVSAPTVFAAPAYNFGYSNFGYGFGGYSNFGNFFGGYRSGFGFGHSNVVVRNVGANVVVRGRNVVAVNNGANVVVRGAGRNVVAVNGGSARADVVVRRGVFGRTVTAVRVR